MSAGILDGLRERGVQVPDNIDPVVAVFAVIDVLTQNRDMMLSLLSDVLQAELNRQLEIDGPQWVDVEKEIDTLLAGGDHPWALPTKTTAGLIECKMGCGDRWCWICSKHLSDCPHGEEDEDGDG